MACRDFAGHHAFYWHCYHGRSVTVRSFDMLLADNAVCYTVQNALKDETQAFARYVRQPTSETEQAYTAACTASEQSLAALPFDYAASARSAMPAHGIFCKGMRAIGRSGILFAAFSLGRYLY